MMKARQPLLIAWHLILVFLVLTAGIGTAGYLYYASQGRHILQTAGDQLASIADLKVGEIVRWRQERLGDAQVISEDSFLASRVGRLFGTSADPDLRNEGLARMESLRSNYGYDSVVLLDAKGEVRYAVPEGKDARVAYGIQMAEEAMRAKKAMLSDFYQSPAAEHGIYITLVAPLVVRNDGNTSAVGAFLLRIDPHRFLYPFIQSWPTPSATAEMVLVRREGNDVVFLNELRHQKNTALALGTLISVADRPAAMAARGERGIVEGVDYRGKRVLAALRAIPGSPWFMVAKVDYDEIHAACGRNAETVGITVALLILAAGVSLGFFWRQQRAESHRRQQQAEAERQALAERFDYLNKYANDIILLMDKDLRIIEANDRAVKSYGYTRDELLQMNLRELRRPEDRATVEAQFKKIGESNGLVFEVVHCRKDGTTFPVEASARAIEIEGKQFYQSIIRDITERKRAERELAESENRYRTLFDDSLEAMSVTMAGKIWNANDAWLKMHGYSDKKEVVGLDVIEIIHPEDRETLVQRRKMPPKERTRLFQVKDLRKDGSVVDVEGYSCAISLGGELTIVTTVRDITERKRAEQQREQALRREEGIAVLLQSLIAPGGLDEKLGMVTDAIVRLFEADFCRIWLIGPGDLCQRGCAHAQVKEGPHVCRNRERCLRLAASSGRYTHLDGDHRRVPFGCYKIGRVASDQEHKFLTNDVQNDPRVHNHEWARDLGLVSFAGYQLRVPGGETLGVMALFAKHPILSDEDAMLDGLGSTVALVIQQAAAEEEIRRLNEGLERRVVERTAELQAANKELESFAYSVSHDLRAPLRAINGFSQVLLEDFADKLNEQGKDGLQRIRAASSRMGDLIDDILQISRVARQEIKRVEIDLSHLAAQVAGELQVADPQRKVDLVIAPDLKGDGDPTLLRLVVQNLIQNAWKFTARTSSARIEMGSGRREGKTVYFVRDNGAGFDMAYVGKLFGAFQRLHSPKEFPGSGIGLATAQRIIHRHGGTIWAEGEVDKGATFYFTLS